MMFVFLNIFGAAYGHQYYSYDGTGNNLHNPYWGAAGTSRIRSYPPLNGYIDNISLPISSDSNVYPSARRIVEELFHVASPKPDKRTNQLMLEFAHFIVMDISATRLNLTDSFSIPCDGKMTDLMLCPFASVLSGSDELPKHHQIEFHRAAYNQSSSPRASMNDQTSFLDLSNMYGINRKKVKKLRNGKYIALDGDGYPSEIDNMHGITKSPGSYVFFVIFARYHNLMAEEHSQREPSLDDDTIFELARMDTIAVYQNIVEETYIPTLLGSKLDPYEGYNSSVDPSIDEFFSSLSFRYGHSSLSGIVNIYDKDFRQMPEGPLLLRDVFLNDPAKIVKSFGIEPFLRGLVSERAKAVDASMVDDLNFWASASSGLDVQRCRDLGIPPYNVVREVFGLSRKANDEDLAGNNSLIVAALESLYGKDGIEKVDAYVGALIEKKETELDMIGPIFIKSVKDQFSRLRDGDRLWYKSRYTLEEIRTFPSLSDIIKVVSFHDDMANFPPDAFIAFGYSNAGITAHDGSYCTKSTNSFSVLDGKININWNIVDSKETFDITLTLNEAMNGTGYIGIGWGCQKMSCSELWFCSVDNSSFIEKGLTDGCAESDQPNNEFISCCVARVASSTHAKPTCVSEEDDIFYPLNIKNSCFSSTLTSFNIQVSICESKESSSSSSECFNLYDMAENENIDFITAYSTIDGNRPHGPSSRTFGTINLSTGSIERSESNNTGIFGVHGICMLFAWLVCAPLGLFVVRYKKTESYRLGAHIFIMAFVGSVMIPLIITAEKSINDGSKQSLHSRIGRVLLPLVYICMIGAGHIRHSTLRGNKFWKFIGKRGKKFALYFHKTLGIITLLMAWVNCYTGLIQIGTDTLTFDFEIVVMNEISVPLGYNLHNFGFFRKYFFFPYLGFVIAMFIFVEGKKRYQSKNQRCIRDDGSDFLGCSKNNGWGTMSMETFSELTSYGNQLCIVNGFVVDYTKFADYHPGGSDMLDFAKGSDITREILGERDVNGVKHRHTLEAINKLKTLIVAKLEVMKSDAESNTIAERSNSSTETRSMKLSSYMTNRNGQKDISLQIE